MSRKHTDAAGRYDKMALYPPRDAIELVKTVAFATFDETVESVFNLGIDPRKADQAMRGTVSLPHGTGRAVRIVVFAVGEAAKDAEDAGADVVGGKELAAEIAAGRELDFDVTIAAPDMMSEVGKLGRILGPRGLMPNPKARTVTPDVGQAVAEFKAGKVEYRNDRYGNLHTVIGKVSFPVDDLVANFAAVADEIIRSRPAAARGRFIRKVSIASTMGPGVKVDPAAVEDLVSLIP